MPGGAVSGEEKCSCRSVDLGDAGMKDAGELGGLFQFSQEGDGIRAAANEELLVIDLDDGHDALVAEAERFRRRAGVFCFGG